MLNLILFGPPGAGKGTQSDGIIEKYNLTHISTGDLFRTHISNGTELGKRAQKYMDQGQLVPDQLVIDMVDDKLNEGTNTSGYIFDGFPRTVAQAEALDDLLSKLNMPINMTLSLEVEDDELIKRILERGKSSGRADDQSIDKIKTRIEVYNSETLPVAEFYASQNKFHKIIGTGSIEEIFENICSVIEENS